MFEDIRPYNDNEVPAAVARVTCHPFFGHIAQLVCPGCDTEAFKQSFLKIKSTYEFQHQIMLRAIQRIIENSSTGLTHSGFELLDNAHRYAFIANHRDILLDAAILQMLLDNHGIETTEITFGSNLMQNELAFDIGKMNKMFKIERGGTMHNFYRSSLEVSSYMRYAILQKHQSTWIAQRNGRTKDGNDKTETGVLKMFSLSSNKPFVENLMELNITPVTISYEYEPCDFMKTQENYISHYQKYIKEPGEDMQSIIKGIIQPKGRIHIAINPTLTQEELAYCDQLEKRFKFSHLAQLVDTKIYSSYKLWKTNYIAHDMLHDSDQFAHQYTPEERTDFIQYMENGLKQLQGEWDELRAIFLGIYAVPVDNCHGK